MNFRFYDTAARDKRDFIPVKEGQLSMYVCGLTVYDLPHIGHARTFIFFDVMRRYLESVGQKVFLVRNHTDIDDKIIRKARERGMEPLALADEMIKGLTQDMTALGVRQADIEPRVSRHIPQIIDMVQKLLDKGHAYVRDGDVYYRISSFPDYGKFSRRNLDDLETGVRVEVDNRKEHPYDFALWKAAKPGEPSWESPWGPGRPGWHIECSAMSTTYLGKTFDVHGGGRDLIFPHHENEIAQSKAALGGEYARYWMHVGMVEIDGEKMSHSLGNFWTIRDILKQVHPEALRYFFLTAHYRNNINFSREAIQESTRRVAYLYRTLEKIDQSLGGFPKVEVPNPLWPELQKISDHYHEAMSDDFNTPKALAAFSEAARLANEWADAKKKVKASKMPGLKALKTLLLEMGQGVGLLQYDHAQALKDITALELKRRNLQRERIETLVEKRTLARKQKNWEEADKIRDALSEMGVQVLDLPQGTTWRLEGI